MELEICKHQGSSHTPPPNPQCILSLLTVAVTGEVQARREWQPLLLLLDLCCCHAVVNQSPSLPLQSAIVPPNPQPVLLDATSQRVGLESTRTGKRK